MKTAELTGRKLDEWVARAESKIVKTFESENGGEVIAAHVGGIGWMVISGGTTMEVLRAGLYRPSEDPKYGQPIMERERIGAHHTDNTHRDRKWEAGTDHVYGSFDGVAQYGPTMLIAGMRARVAQVYGDEVPA